MMAFLNGLLLLNAPASALNNAGAAETGKQIILLLSKP